VTKRLGKENFPIMVHNDFLGLQEDGLTVVVSF
jgi:hypothetical protein